VGHWAPWHDHSSRGWGQDWMTPKRKVTFWGEPADREVRGPSEHHPKFEAQVNTIRGRLAGVLVPDVTYYRPRLRYRPAQRLRLFLDRFSPSKVCLDYWRVARERANAS
jgi:hypothetical protein